MVGAGRRMQGLAWWALLLLAGIMHTMGLHTPSMRMAAQSRLAMGEVRGDRLTTRWAGAAAAAGGSAAAAARPTRLRGGGMSEDEEDSEDTRPTFKGSGAKLAEAAPAPAAGSAATAKEDEEVSGSAAAAQEGGADAADDTGAGEDADAKMGEGEEEVEGEEAVEEKAPLEPEMVRKMNKMLMEASLDGNEPLVDKALKNGANVNAFIRGPDR